MRISLRKWKRENRLPELFAALYNEACVDSPKGQGYLTVEEAAKKLKQNGLFIPTLDGRSLSVDFRNPTWDPWQYDRDNGGRGTARKVVRRLRIKEDILLFLMGLLTAFMLLSIVYLAILYFNRPISTANNPCVETPAIVDDTPVVIAEDIIVKNITQESERTWSFDVVGNSCDKIIYDSFCLKVSGESYWEGKVIFSLRDRNGNIIEANPGIPVTSSPASGTSVEGSEIVFYQQDGLGVLNYGEMDHYIVTLEKGSVPNNFNISNIIKFEMFKNGGTVSYSSTIKN